MATPTKGRKTVVAVVLVRQSSITTARPVLHSATSMQVTTSVISVSMGSRARSAKAATRASSVIHEWVFRVDRASVIHGAPSTAFAMS